jgi:hypothetical protein
LVEVVVNQTWDSSTPSQVHNLRRWASGPHSLLIRPYRDEAAVADRDCLDGARSRIDRVDASVPQDEVGGLCETGSGREQEEREYRAREAGDHADLLPSSRKRGAGKAHSTIVVYGQLS